MTTPPKSVYITIAAMAFITGLITVAMFSGLDGAMLNVGVAILAGLGGFAFTLPNGKTGGKAKTN